MQKKTILLCFLFASILSITYALNESEKNPSSSHQAFLPCRPADSPSSSTAPSSSAQAFLPCRPADSPSSSIAPSSSAQAFLPCRPAESTTSTSTATNSASTSNSATPSTSFSSTPSTSLSATPSTSLSSIPSPSGTSAASLSSTPSVSATPSTSLSGSTTPSTPASQSNTPSLSSYPTLPPVSPSPSVPVCVPSPSPSPECDAPSKKVVTVNYRGLCCSSPNGTSMYPQGTQIETSDVIVDVNFDYDNVLECSDGNCDMQAIISDLFSLWGNSPCEASTLFKSGAHQYFHLSDEDPDSLSAISSLDLSQPAQLDLLFGFIQQVPIEILSTGFDVERQTATFLAKVRFSFPYNTNQTGHSEQGSSSNFKGCILKDTCDIYVNAEGVNLWVSILFVFDRESCLIEEIVVIPNRKDVLSRELSEVNARIPSSNFCFLDCSAE